MATTHVKAEEIAKALSISDRTVRWRSEKENWNKERIKGTKGVRFHYPISSLPPDVQIALVKAGFVANVEGLCPEAAIELSKKMVPALLESCGMERSALAPWRETNGKKPVGLNVIEDPRAMKILRILSEISAPPAGMTKGAWIAKVAENHGVARQTIYKWMDRHEKEGLAGLKQSNPSKGIPRAWDKEALDWWTGLCLKHEHRNIDSKKALYWDVLIIEAHRRGWRIGSERSALDYALKIPPQLKVLQKRGSRGLDNALPPIRRDYSDLDPFQIIVGDQHRFDFWVQDEETGRLFRPEGYFWQDLRTRLWYGGAVDEKYDGHLMGLGLYIGCLRFGGFGCLYNDNGKPEQSRYIMSVAADIRRLGMSIERLDDDLACAPSDLEESDDIELYRVGQRFAIVKNAKAKMIEGSFDRLQTVMRSTLRIPGYTKRLGGNPEENDMDEAEIKRLAASGRLLTPDEFRLAVYQAMEFMNREMSNRNLPKEWNFGPKPKQVKPWDVLQASVASGWKPRQISAEALALVFLKREKRKVQKGQIEIFGDFWEPADEMNLALMSLEGQKAEVRFDPMNLCEILVFDGAGNFVCIAEPSIKSSMIDSALTAAANARKRRQRRMITDQYKQLTAGIIDVRHYSEVPREEKAVARIEMARKKKQEIEDQRNKPLTQEDLDAGMAKLIAGEAEAETRRKKKRLPERPSGGWTSEYERYKWVHAFVLAGGELNEEDTAFKARYESNMDDEDREMWNARAIYGG